MSKTPEEITVKDWKGFCDYCHGLEFAWGERAIFRGHQNAGDELTSSLYRELKNNNIPTDKTDKINEIEEELIKAFVKKWLLDEMSSYVKHHLFFQVLSIMQHYGIKTRMLDWTISWQVAAYFATESEPRLDKKDAVVWCINKTKIEENLKNKCKKYEDISRCSGKGFMEWCRRCSNFCNPIFFRDSMSSDIRMIIQASVLTYCPEIETDQIECITEVLGEETDEYCKKIIIKSELKPEFRGKFSSLKEKIYPVICGEWFSNTFRSIISKYENN